jgi:hypothetical protein
MDEVSEALWVRINALRAERNAWYACTTRFVVIDEPRKAVLAELEQVETWFKILEEAAHARREALVYLEEAKHG